MNAGLDALVVGASGPIGTATMRALSQSGFAAVGASRTGDVRLNAANIDETRELLVRLRPATVVLLANSTGTDAAAAESAAEYMAAFARVARSAHVTRIVYASSAAVYGGRIAGRIGERDRCAGSTPYALVKIRSERALATANLSTLSLRIFNVYGTGAKASLINKLLDGPPPRLLMTDAFVRDYVHVDDVASAIVSAMAAPEVQGVLNVGTGNGVGNLQLAKCVRSGAFEPAPSEDIRSVIVADPVRAHDQLGWQAKRHVLCDLEAAKLS